LSSIEGKGKGKEKEKREKEKKRKRERKKKKKKEVEGLTISGLSHWHTRDHSVKLIQEIVVILILIKIIFSRKKIFFKGKKTLSTVSQRLSVVFHERRP